MKTVFKTGLALSFASVLLIGCGGGGGTTNPTNPTNPTSGTEITLVDGYIKDAIVKDANGNTATYMENGTYKFNVDAVYPITSTGGILIDTNATFDVNLTTISGEVISPITTLIAQNNQEVINALSSLTGFSDVEDYSVDYMNTDNLEMAKIAQSAYLLLKNDLVSDFGTHIQNNGTPLNINDLFVDINETINNSSLNIIEKSVARNFNDNVRLFNEQLSSIETLLNEAKEMTKKMDDFDDADGDGILNHIEVSRGLNITGGADFNATEDTDGDGITNLMEIIAGLDMNVANTSNYTKNIVDENNNIFVRNSDSAMIADIEGMSTTAYTFDEANEYCNNLSFGGYSDWSALDFPTLLSTISSAYPATMLNIPLYFSNVDWGNGFYEVGNGIWSSNEMTSTNGWRYNYETNGVGSELKSEKLGVICGRGF